MTIRRTVSWITFTIAATLAMAGAAHAQGGYYGGPVYSPAPVRAAMYDYVYYPSAQVYYAPSRRVWFWYDGYRWNDAFALPYGLNIDLRIGGIPIQLRSFYPYREHHYVDSYYGRPWRERYFRENARHEWREHERREWREREQWREAGRGYPRYEGRNEGRYEGHGEREHHRW